MSGSADTVAGTFRTPRQPIDFPEQRDRDQMAKDRVTAQDVALRAGVSQSAVSRVFTEGASVSPKTEEKVREAAAELGYRPNVLARSLITGRSRLIGLVVAYLDNQFYTKVLENLSSALQREGYHVLIFMTSQTDDNLEEILEQILDYQVDGIIAASVDLSSALAAKCQSAGIPVVLFNRNQDDERLSAVTSDNISGARKVADFLVAGGHKTFGYIAGREGSSTQRDREAGFCDGLRNAGFELCAREVGNYQFETARKAGFSMFSKPDYPEAVFVAGDHMAIAVMDVIRFELGLRVPEDVSVVGYGDAPPASWPAYNLTTVRQSADEMVAETVGTLLAQIEDRGATPRRIALDGPLVIRESARKPARPVTTPPQGTAEYE